MSNAVIACIGLGANLGDAAATLRTALHELGALPQTHLLRASRLYRTPAWGVEAQPDFINAVAALETRLPTRKLLEVLFEMERKHGRDRSREQRWGPRTLDLDLLLYGEMEIDEAGLRVPHRYITQRVFVLLPLLEIAPDVVIPGYGLAQNALSAMSSSEINNIVALPMDNAVFLLPFKGKARMGVVFAR
jgi:2-amino-4-hydroxy-6-hydroxymethyldihydropteridine diphosphokinase